MPASRPRPARRRDSSQLRTPGRVALVAAPTHRNGPAGSAFSSARPRPALSARARAPPEPESRQAPRRGGRAGGRHGRLNAAAARAARTEDWPATEDRPRMGRTILCGRAASLRPLPILCPDRCLPPCQPPPWPGPAQRPGPAPAQRPRRRPPGRGCGGRRLQPGPRRA